MARVALQSDAGKTIDGLPMVCLKCGAPATVCKSKKFTWTPPEVRRTAYWLPLVFSFILTMRQTKRQWVETPLCEAHKGYWWKLPVVMNSLIALVFVLGVPASVVIWVRTQNSELSQDACMGTVTAFVALVIVAAVLGKSRIRVEKITEGHIVLTGVAREFVDAVEDQEDRLGRAFDRAAEDGAEAS